MYPDMRLYQEIIFLQYNSVCHWVVENVNPYYTPLIQPTANIGRHLFWSDQTIDSKYHNHSAKLRRAQIPELQEYHNIDLNKYKIQNKRQLLRNCVDSDLALYVFNEVVKNED